jgi:hypothetical protein
MIRDKMKDMWWHQLPQWAASIKKKMQCYALNMNQR